MKTRDLPWGRCSKAIRNGCKNPCSHYLAHHISPWGHCWCHCEPVERPAECKSWAGYNRALTLQPQTEDSPGLRNKYRYDRKTYKRIIVGKALCPNPHTHINEKEFEKGE